MKIMLAASEVTGFAKTGGLADVAASLPLALARRGHECIVFLPLYRCTRNNFRQPLLPTDHTVTVKLGQRQVQGRLWRSTLAGEVPVTVYLVEQGSFFDRDDPKQGRGLYQFNLPSGQRADYPDNCERFVFFSRAVLEALPLLGFQPDIVHANDWQTALIPALLRVDLDQRPGGFFRSMRTLFTIHNIAYQGLFWQWDMVLTGLDWKLYNAEQLEFYGKLNFLKGGIVFADAVNTVSPTYAREIQTPAYGCGLQGVLGANKERLFGIVNGVDYRVWNPASDTHLPRPYDVDTVAEGKPASKAALQRAFHLPELERAPVLGMIARLVEQKGIELVVQTAEAFLSQGAQLIILGEGDRNYHRMLTELRERFPDRVGLLLGFDETLAHQIEAGSDAYLMPSQYEPSGLNQLYSLKYGTVPIVRATGGLADTVVDCTPETLANGTATGFCFGPHQATALLECIHRTLAVYHQQPDIWLQLVRNGMRQDWSWDRSAAEYEQLYARLLEAGRS